ncbi:MAG TPA: hypothetical protein VJP05_02200, partial [Acidimicrobiia bacterium]|nr:hypothetical protein [Acidimicrobiia bacterium]
MKTSRRRAIRSARMRWLVAFLVVAGLTVVPIAPAVALGGEVAYDSIPSPLAGNYPSLGFQATQTDEFGDHIALEPSTSRDLLTIDVGMSSWGCESGAWNTLDCLSLPGATF